MPRIDLYTAIHKSLRAALFHLSTHAGATDFADEGAAARLGEELSTLAARLRAHVRHEDRFIQPVIAERAPELHGSLAGAHATYDEEIDAIEEAFAAARAARAPEASLAFYRALNRFITHNLAHFDEEERGMSVLWEKCSDADLAAIMAAFHASRTRAQALADLETMLPALSHPERAAMVRALDDDARRKLSHLLA